MSSRIEDYAVIGATMSAALVGRDGSIDWLCVPRFDSGACFAALLGTPDNGRWRIAPTGDHIRIERHYRNDSLVLETIYTTPDGVVRVIDCMPVREKHPHVVRCVEGISGRVAMRMELIVRFDYGSIVPWVRTSEGRLHAVAGPDALVLATPIATRGEGSTTIADFFVAAGDRIPFTLTWHESHVPAPASVEPYRSISETDSWWRQWASRRLGKATAFRSPRAAAAELGHRALRQPFPLPSEPEAPYRDKRIQTAHLRLRVAERTGRSERRPSQALDPTRYRKASTRSWNADDD